MSSLDVGSPDSQASQRSSPQPPTPPSPPDNSAASDTENQHVVDTQQVDDETVNYDVPDITTTCTDEAPVGFIPNDPDSDTYYPVYIPNPNYVSSGQGLRIMVAPYIMYSPDYLHVTGTRGQGHERRTIPVYIGREARHFQIMTSAMWKDFEYDGEMEFLVNDSMAHLNNPRLTGEINRFRGKTQLARTLEKMMHDLEGQVREVQGQLVRTYDELASCKMRLERADVYGELYRLNRRRYPLPASSGPLEPRHRGPVEMPILADGEVGAIRNQKARRSKKNKMRCYTCRKRGHPSYECPTRKREEGEVTEESMRQERLKLLQRIEWTPATCIKCGKVNPRHTALECPKYEYCRRCGGNGAYGFLRKTRVSPANGR